MSESIIGKGVLPQEQERYLLPPHSTEAERSVLGACLQSGAALSEALELLRDDDFYQPAHATIFKAMRDLCAQGRAVDLITIREELIRQTHLETVGGNIYLVDLMQSVPTLANTRHYVDIVIEKSTLRKLIHASQTISQTCYQQEDTLENTLMQAEKLIFDIVMKRTGSQQLKHISEVLKGTYAHMEELARNKGKIAGVPTGFSRLDDLLTGIHGGELVLVGARPSMGKTSFAINIAAHASLKGYSVAVFSLEMPNEQIAMRVLCCEGRINMQRVRQGVLQPKEWEKLAMTLAPLAQAPLYLDDTASLTPTQLRSRCRRLMMDKNLDLVIIDYLQLMSTDGRPENRQQEVSEISRRLKSIALELKVPIIACAQLSRANVQRADKRPMLSDLRDSGSIEQDADVVMFLHRQGYYEELEEGSNLAEVIVAKQRNGPLDTIKLYWHDEYTLFEDIGHE